VLYLRAVKIFRLVFLVLSWPLLPACLSLQSDEQKAEVAEKTLLAKHDELMGRMDQLYDLRQRLQSAPVSDTVLVGQRRRSLLRADGAMMSWMHQYHKPADSLAPDQQLAYFEAQQHFMDSVGVLMEHSIDSAELVLKRAEPATQPSAK
jgi:hypothetical protein